MSNFPTTLDDDTSLHLVTDGVDAITAAHHNDLKDAIKAVEAKVGIYNTGAPTALDYRLGHPTSGHNHNGASGQGAPIAPSALSAAIASAIPNAVRFRLQSQDTGMYQAAGTIALPPIYVDRTVQLESLSFIFDKGPSGATGVWDINLGATSLWYASQGLRPMIAATTGFAMATYGTPNTVTIPSGSILHIDQDQTVTSGLMNPSLTFVFRE